MANIDKLQINGTDYSITAARLSNTAAIGSTTQPVYFNASGVPVACNSTLGVNISGNAATATTATSATKATQDSDGNAINTTYLKRTTVTSASGETEKQVSVGYANLNLYKLKYVDTPVDDNDAATKKYVDEHTITDYVSKSGGTFSGTVYGTQFSATEFLANSFTTENGDVMLKTSNDDIYLGNTGYPLHLQGYNQNYITFDNGAGTSYIPMSNSTSIGSSSKPIYISNGVLTTLSSTLGSGSRPVYLNNGSITSLVASLTSTNHCQFFSVLSSNTYGSTTSGFEFAYDFVGYADGSTNSGTHRLWIRAGRFQKTSAGDKTSGTTSYSFNKPMTTAGVSASFVSVTLSAGPGMSTDPAYINAVMVTGYGNSTTNKVPDYSGFYYNAGNSETGYIYFIAIGYKKG